MAKYSIEDSTLTAIADAIREKAESADSYKPGDMPAAILAIQSGAAEIEEVTNTAGGKTVYINSEPEEVSELPEGFTRLQYIRSTGSQYLASNFKPNQNTRVVMDFRNNGDYSSLGAGVAVLFGTRNGQSDSAFALWLGATSYPQYGSVAYNANGTITTDINKRLIYDFNKNVVSIGGETITCASKTFASGYPLYFLTLNQAGAVQARYASGDWYAGQAYDDGVLALNYIPCLNESGEAGMWETVTQEFFGDAAGVGFIAGPKAGVSKVVLEDRTLIDLTNDTISPETVLAGFIGHDKTGAQFVGELVQKAGGRPFAHGTATCATSGTVKINITGLSFTPTIVFLADMVMGTAKSYQLWEAFRDQENSRYYYLFKDSYGSVYQTNEKNVLTLKDGGFELLYVYPGVTTFATSYHWYAIGPEG